MIAGRGIKLLCQFTRAQQRTAGGGCIAGAKLRFGKADEQDGVHLVKKAGGIMILQAGKHCDLPVQDVLCRAVVLFIKKHVEVAHRRLNERNGVVEKRFGKKRQGFGRVLVRQ